MRTADGAGEYPRATTNTIEIVVDLRKSPDLGRFEREVEKGLRRAMPEFYVFAYMRHRASGALKSAALSPLGDVFRGGFPGSVDDAAVEWDVMAVIQTVNTANREDPPTEHAAILGGLTYSKNFYLEADPGSGSCRVTPSWDLTVTLT